MRQEAELFDHYIIIVGGGGLPYKSYRVPVQIVERSLLKLPESSHNYCRGNSDSFSPLKGTDFGH